VADLPERPRAETREQLGFEPQGMVRWFDPVQLAGTAVQVVVSSLFGAYSDKREIQAALAATAEPHLTHGEDGDLWFDYVADLGDGFPSTYTVAHTLARPTLELSVGDGAPARTERGRILVMGGDQVYPTATRKTYEDRLVGPYRAARPYDAEAVETLPTLYAIPGNHDWYDGLTNFMRIFCKPTWIGAWRTGQERSYFALRLPRNWWLWGIDIQFDSYIDEPQLDYFRSASKKLGEGDRLILVTGKPSWTKGMGPNPEPSYANLAYFEDELLKDTKAALSVVVSGDLHHYAHYVDASGGRHRITCGGGGAYLFPTHHLRGQLELEEGRKATKRTDSYSLASCYPPTAVSRRLRWCALWRLPLRNARLLWFLGALYFLVALLLRSPARRAVGAGGNALDASAGVWLDALWSPRTLFAAMVLVPLFVLFAAGRGLGTRALVGIPHAAAHLLLMLTLVVISAQLISAGWDSYGLIVAAVAAAVATPLGAGLIGLYLALCDLAFAQAPERLGGLERHANEVFSCQAIGDWKSFLRFHIAADGTLTIYPIGIERVARRGELQLDPDGAAEASFFRLPGTVRAQLIEDPIEVR
jgi:hypothetical protein